MRILLICRRRKRVSTYPLLYYISTKRLQSEVPLCHMLLVSRLWNREARIVDLPADSQTL